MFNLNIRLALAEGDPPGWTIAVERDGQVLRKETNLSPADVKTMLSWLENKAGFEGALALGKQEQDRVLEHLTSRIEAEEATQTRRRAAATALS